MKNIKLLSLLSGIILSMSACEDVFDVPRVGAITPEQMWDSPEYILKYVNNLYPLLPEGNRNDLVSAEANVADLSTHNFVKGKLLITDGFPEATWDYSYNRTLNVFFENIKKSTAKFKTGEKEALIGQAYFFRAYLYYKMVRCYGGVPIITSVQDPSADINTLLVKRNSSKECFEFIQTQLDSAILLLPARGTLGYGPERITKGAAMAVKSQVLILKASPLFSVNRNDQYWNEAYNATLAAKNELDKEGYGFYEDGTKRSFENMYYNKAAALKEMVIYIAHHNPLKKNNHVAAQLPLSQSSGATGGQQPTWEMVQAFPMKDGKSIKENPDYDQSMFWVNRDPRFYSTIVYNGASYGLGSTNRRQWNFVEFGGAGADGYQAVDGTYTGFYCRKWIDTTLSKFSTKPYQDQAFDWPIIRYPEVLLDLAECANQVDAYRADVKALIISIRKRAGIEAGSDNNYGLETGVGSDKTITLNAIMRERQIEFAFEGKRYWDLRRLRMFSELNAMQYLHGMKPSLNMQGVLDLELPEITENSSIIAIMNALTTKCNDPGVDVNLINKQVTNYTVEIIDNSPEGGVKIPDQYYFYPLNPDWIKQNPNLEQNKGWDTGTFDPTIQQ